MIELHLRSNVKYVYKQTKICYLTLHHGRRHFELFCNEINILLYVSVTVSKHVTGERYVFI